MNKRNQIDQNSTDHCAADETDSGATIGAVIAMVSHLESEIRSRNPIAAYLLLRCRLSLIQDEWKSPDPRAKN
jgi:hypothetical protein